MIKLFILLALFSGIIFAKDVEITQEKNPPYTDFYLQNNNPYHITITYTAEYSDLEIDKFFPLTQSFEPNSKTYLFSVKPIGKNIVFKGNYNWVMGTNEARHDNTYLYRLPFETRKTVRITQGFNETFSHFGQSRYAVDFDMKVGDKIYAMRDGIVVQTKSDSNLKGTSKDYEQHANFITVRHPDNTYCTYAHLQQNSVFVKVGDTIKRGDMIGLSGDTGYSNGPHLHVIVFAANDGKSREPIGIKFKTNEGIMTYPKRGMAVTAIP